MKSKSRRAVLLAEMDGRCVASGHWFIQGYEVRRRHGGGNRWRVEGRMFETFTDAVEWIAQQEEDER